MSQIIEDIALQEGVMHIGLFFNHGYNERGGWRWELSSDLKSCLLEMELDETFSVSFLIPPELGIRNKQLGAFS